MSWSHFGLILILTQSCLDSILNWSHHCMVSMSCFSPELVSSYLSHNLVSIRSQLGLNTALAWSRFPFSLIWVSTQSQLNLNSISLQFCHVSVSFWVSTWSHLGLILSSTQSRLDSISNWPHHFLISVSCFSPDLVSTWSHHVSISTWSRFGLNSISTLS